MNFNIKPLSRNNDLVVQELNGETLIYDLNTNKAFCLNQTSALIWQICDGTKSIAEICQEISRKLKTTVKEDFIWLALDSLKKEGLIANADEITDGLQKMSRREVVRKIGLTSIAALPVIISLAAPTAAQSASQCAEPTNRPNGCSCNSNTQCTAPSFCCFGTCVAAGTPCIG